MIILFFVLLSGLPEDIPDGTLILSEHSKRIVEKISSPITHVGIIFTENNKTYVYEANRPVVHKVPITEYYGKLLESKKTTPELEFWIAEPKILFSDIEIRSMRSYAESQMGRKYSIKGYVRNNPNVEGTHCAQYVCDVLTRSRRFWSKNAASITPESLWESVSDKFNKRKLEFNQAK